MKTLKDLFLAMCNATVLLLIILTTLLVILIGRANDLRKNTGSAVSHVINEQSARIDVISEQLQQINSKLDQVGDHDIEGIKAQLSDIRESLPMLSGRDEITLKRIAEQVLSAAQKRLMSPPVEGGE